MTLSKIRNSMFYKLYKCKAAGKYREFNNRSSFSRWYSSARFRWYSSARF